MTISNLDNIWKEFDNNRINSENLGSDNSGPENLGLCTYCLGNNLNINVSDLICQDCGLVISENYISSTQAFDVSTKTENNCNTNSGHQQKRSYNANHKINKMQEWLMWTNDEKNIYKLKTYVQNLCHDLKIVECLIEPIVNTIVIVMNSIRQNDGTKRARVKDGIIVICIHYVSKNTSTPYSYIDISKRLNLNIKYVTKAEKFILELINSKKLNLDKSIILNTQAPYDYVITIVKNNNLNIDTEILDKTKYLIEICEDNDLLLDHTPLSIGVCCFYYILKTYDDNIDLKIFSDLYNLSGVTIIKTYNKLKVYDCKIKKLLQSN